MGVIDWAKILKLFLREPLIQNVGLFLAVLH